MAALLDRNRVLDLWAKGLTAPDIAGRIGHPNWHAITRVVCDAREKGDPRATRRAHGKAATQAPPTPKPVALRCPDLGITATEREVPNRNSLGTSGSERTRVSVARLSCIEKPLDLPLARSPELAP